VDLQHVALEFNAGSGLPGIVTTSAAVGYRDFRVLGEISTSFLHFEAKLLAGVIKGSDYYMIGVNSGSGGGAETTSQWEGVTVRYGKSQSLGSSDYFFWYYNFDLDADKDDGIYGDGRWRIGPAVGVGFTFKPL
jgi:hypothetical protein